MLLGRALLERGLLERRHLVRDSAHLILLLRYRAVVPKSVLRYQAVVPKSVLLHQGKQSEEDLWMMQCCKRKQKSPPGASGGLSFFPPCKGNRNRRLPRKISLGAKNSSDYTAD